LAGVLLFGGSFDPIHHGHLRVCRSVAQQLGVQRTILIPNANPPHKSSAALAAAADRLELCRLAVREDPQFSVSDWETRQSGPNYSLLAVRHFRDELGDEAELYWLIGADSLAELHTWHQPAELIDACTLVTAGRPGWERPDLAALRALLGESRVRRLLEQILPTPLIDISATQIREKLRRGQSIRGLVPRDVEQAIAARRLYAGA